MLISVRKHVIDYEYEEAYVLDEGYFMITSDQKLLIEKNEDEEPQDGNPHPECFVLGKNHVAFVGNSRTPLTQKFLAGKDSFGRMSARRC